MFILSWGGLRGVVGLVLAMIVSMDQHLGATVSDKHYCIRVLIHVAGIVVLTTLLNAASLELLIDKLGLKSPSIIETQIVQASVSTLSRRNKAFIEQAMNPHDRPELSRVHWESVNAIVGFQDSFMQERNVGNLMEQRRKGGALNLSLGRHLRPIVQPNDVGATADSKMKQYFHSQYLLALRCSFDSQVEDCSLTLLLRSVFYCVLTFMQLS
jgi:NhaP-type Na+/H+ or K+/H+ antiporter